ncbi:MAG: AMP-binding protein [Terracidiphilus sp.]
MHVHPCAALGAIAQNAEINPYGVALIEPDGLTLDYRELWAQIVEVGRRLEEAGITSRQTIAILLPQGAGQVIAVAGALNYCVCAPLQPRTTPAEVEAALGKLGASALIVSPEFEAEAKAASALGLTILVAGKGSLPKDWQIHHAAAPVEVRATTSAAIMRLVTSATTSRSKVVPLTAENLDAGSAARRDSLRLTASDRMLLMTSLSHSIGIGTTLSQFLAGGSVIATGGFDSAAYTRWLSNLRPTWYDCAPTVHQAVFAQLQRTPLQNPVPLRFVQSAGAPLPGEVRQGLEQLLQVPVFNDYGMTEACAIATDAFLPEGRVANSAGRSCGMQIGIIDPLGRPLPTGADGEIVVRGLAVFPGYEDDDEANRNAFQDGWFRTGDLGRLDGDGNLFVTGRLKEMINRGGEKILPGEVDEVFASHPAVLEAAAFAVTHPTLGEDVACAVVLRSGAESKVSARELRRYATQHLASFKVPYRIYFVDEIPRGELGKPQRWVLADELGKKRGTAPTPAEVTKQILANAVAVNLHEIWERILDRDDLGFDEDFFEAGGDSLAAISMLAEVDRRFGSETSAQAADFIDEPTLAQLARMVGNPSPPKMGDRNSSEMHVFPVSDEGCCRRLFCFPTDGLEGLPFRRLAKHLQGEMDLSIVRPANAWHSRSLFIFENSAAEAAALIRQVQPQGPYFLCGDCFGGIVATETAHQLSLAGHEVRVILFDTLFPGFPRFVRDWRIWMEAVGRQWRRLWTSKHPGVRKNLITLGRQVIWSAVVPFRRFLAPIQNVPTMHRILEWALGGEQYPFYKVFALDAPFLHILSADEPSVLTATGAAGRFTWREYARGGLLEQYVPFDHNSILHESNLPEIVKILRRWCGIHSSAAHRSA